MFVHVCRVEVEEQNDRSLAMFQKSATLHSEEVKRFQENLFRQKGLAEQYSQHITELEQGKAGLEAELLDVRARMERAMQEAGAASREVGGEDGEDGFEVLQPHSAYLLWLVGVWRCESPDTAVCFILH